MNWWPQCEWKTIHNTAASLTAGDEENFILWVELTLKLLPCKECRKNGQKELKEIPVRDYIYGNISEEHIKKYNILEKTNNVQFSQLSLNERAFIWTYLLHDIVNLWLTKYGKDRMSPPYDVVKDIYWTKLGVNRTTDDDDDCPSCNF